MIKGLGFSLKDPQHGISSYIQCIKLNKKYEKGSSTKFSYEINSKSIKALSTVLFMNNSLDSRRKVKDHPKYHIIINNVSRFGDDYDPKEK